MPRIPAIALMFVATWTAGCGSARHQPAKPTLAPAAVAPRERVRVPESGRARIKADDAAFERATWTQQPQQEPAPRMERAPDEIRATIARGRGRIQQCYRRALAGNPRLAGKVVISWRVAASGAVSRTRIVESTLGDRRLERCVRRHVANLRFKPARHGAGDVVVFPFVFAPY